MIKNIKAIWQRAQIKFLRKPSLMREHDKFLNEVMGVIHVGANDGGERDLYRKHGLRVIWVEPIPEVFEKLKVNLVDFPEQQAFQYLITDEDDKEYPFHLSNNHGASSSILDLKLHKDMWPAVVYERTILLKSKTLMSLLESEHINPCNFDALVLDTQGSELLVLKGAIPILANFRYIKVEVPDFESYEGCCEVADIASFLKQFGYIEYSRHEFAKRIQGGSYYDIVYKKTGAEFEVGEPILFTREVAG